MRLIPAIALLVATSTLTACGIGERFGLGFGRTNIKAGLPYRASLSRGSGTDGFTVRVSARGATLEQARESARYPATRYCLQRTGSSGITWVIDPATGDWAFTRDGGDLSVRGRCNGLR